MKWVYEVDASLETYNNTNADKARVAHMAHRFVDEPDRATIIAMLFQPPRNRNQT